LKRSAPTGFVFVLGILIFSAVSRVYAEKPKADEIIQKVQQRIRSAKLVQARFVQIFQWSVAGERQEFQGEIWIGPNDAFRIESADQLIVSNGKDVWTYDKVNRQVIIDHLNPDQENYLPRQLSLKFARTYRARFEGKEKLSGQTVLHVRLISKNPDVFIRSFELWIDPATWVVRKLSYVDANDNVTTYEVRSVRFLKKAKPSLFRFSPPEGVEVVDLRS